MGLSKDEWTKMSTENREEFEKQITWNEQDELGVDEQLERADKAIAEYEENLRQEGRNELYEMRNALVVALAKMAHKRIVYEDEQEDVSYVCRTQIYPKENTPVEEGWFLLFIKFSSGQVSFHLPISLWDYLQEIPIVEKGELPFYVSNFRFDEHTSKDVVQRLLDC